MKYIIVGAGPAGLSLAYILSKHNYDIVLIEKDIKIRRIMELRLDRRKILFRKFTKSIILFRLYKKIIK